MAANYSDNFIVASQRVDNIEMADSVLSCCLHLKEVYFEEIALVLVKFPRKMKAYS